MARGTGPFLSKTARSHPECAAANPGSWCLPIGLPWRLPRHRRRRDRDVALSRRRPRSSLHHPNHPPIEPPPWPHEGAQERTKGLCANQHVPLRATAIREVRKELSPNEAKALACLERHIWPPKTIGDLNPKGWVGYGNRSAGFLSTPSAPRQLYDPIAVFSEKANATPPLTQTGCGEDHDHPGAPLGAMQS